MNNTKLINLETRISAVIAGCLILFILVFILNSKQALSAEGDSINFGDLSCKAKNTDEFKKCLEDVKNGVFPLIRLTENLECRSKQECEFSLEGVVSQVTIAGDKTVIKRSENFNYSIFNFSKSANIKLTNISFDEGDGSGCPGFGQVCQPVINIQDSQNIVIQNLRVHGARESAIKITNSASVAVMGSQILNSYKNAIQVSLPNLIEGVVIDGNTFENNGSSAVVFSGISLATSPSKIRANTFKKNHSKAVYTSCTFPCSAGQLLIKSGTTNLLIENNIITDGTAGMFDRFGLYPSGIEVPGADSQSVIISCNMISNNKGSGIVQTGTVRANNNTVIQDNKIFDNGINLNVQSAYLEDNCFYKDCRVACSSVR